MDESGNQQETRPVAQGTADTLSARKAAPDTSRCNPLISARGKGESADTDGAILNYQPLYASSRRSDSYCDGQGPWQGELL